MKRFVLAFTVALLALSFGCVQNPNSNLQYTGCCAQSQDEYTCQPRVDAGGKYILVNGRVILEGCGECRYWDNKNGQVYDSSDSSANPLKDADGNLLNPKNCPNNCNFVKADCSNADGKNTCYGEDAEGKKIPVAPICISAEPNPCIKNDCEAMVCHAIVPKVRLTADSKSMQARAKDTNPSPLEYASNKGGLYAKACEFMRLDRIANTILKKEDSYINAFRLGIQGTFSDYDRARYYMPPTDFYCAGERSEMAVVDRFTRYLDGGNRLSEFGGGTVVGECADRPIGDGVTGDYYCESNGATRDYDCTGMNEDFCEVQKTRAKRVCDNLCSATTGVNFKAKLHGCVESNGCWSCTANEDLEQLKFCKEEYGTLESAESACAKICSNAQFPVCSENSGLLVLEQVVSPPYSQGEGVKMPFVDIEEYYALLNKAYPIPADVDNVAPERNPLNYYHTMPELREGMSQQEIDDAVAELLKPGPGGARVFECLEDTDCLSGNCDKGVFSRSACVHKETGASIPCGCTLVKNCAANFMCEAYEAGTRRRAICDYSRMLCDWTAGDGNLKLICDYTPRENPPGDGWVASGQYDYKVNRLANFEAENTEDNRDALGQRLEVELANIQTLAYEDKCYDEGAEENQQWTEMRDGECADGYKKEKYYYWVDETRAFQGEEYTRTFAPVPDKQTIWGVWPDWGGSGAYIITSRDTTIDKLKEKFPIIEACNMEVSEDMENKNADVVKVDATKYRGTQEQATKNLPVKIYADKEDYYWRWDSTWLIKSLGDCRISDTGIPQVLTYGVCKPCSSMLSYAYQNVSDYVPSNSARNAYCTGNLDQCNVEGYCPSACKLQYGSGGHRYCYCPNEKESFIPIMSGSPKTNPDFSHLASKIDEYQAASIIPILDLREYSIAVEDNADSQKKIYGMDKNSCEKLGGVHTEKECDERSRNICTKWTDEYCTTTVHQKDDYLLKYLANNRSAVILLVADVPQDCADENIAGSADGKDCTDAISKIKNASMLCPNCILAVEYPQVIGEFLEDYPDGLRETITKFSAGGASDERQYRQIHYEPEHYGQPRDSQQRPILTSALPPQIANVDVLFLNVDFGNIPAGSVQDAQEQLEKAADISRKVLQHVGYKSIYKMRITKSGSSQNDGAYANEQLYHALNGMQDTMAVSGMIGLLLPPLDNGDVESERYAREEYGNLVYSQAGESTLEAVKNENLPFCAAQMGSTSFLHPQITVAIHKLISKETCACIPCSQLEIQNGLCGQDKSLCMDADPCQIVDGENSKYATSEDSVKCTQGCFRMGSSEASGMQACKDLDTQVTCRKVESSNSIPKVCNTYADLPNCGIITFTLSELETNVFLLPYQPELIAGLSANKKCYVGAEAFEKTGGSVITYSSLMSTATSSQPLIYPLYGSTSTDCGMGSFEEYNPDLCQESRIPLPLKKSAWICS